MPGAFAHLTAANLSSCGTNALSKIGMPTQAKLALSRNIKFIELGCVSPDYPYLALGDKQQNEWADLMHYEKTGELIRHLASECMLLSDDVKGKVFAWLCGYVSHVIADITIHPVVELKVGPYSGNETAHRICEMNQDTYIWQRLNLGEIGLADRVELNIGSCADSNGSLDVDITNVWGACLNAVHPDYATLHLPNFDKWHYGFQNVVNNAEEGYRFFKWARHISADLGLLYPRPLEIDMTYINKLNTPKGLMDYDEIFDLAVDNIQKYIGILGLYVFGSGSLEQFKNWNLDTGRDESGVLTTWS